MDEATEHETRLAIRMVYRVVFFAFVLYFATSLVVHEDARLAWYGRSAVQTDELVARGGRRMYTTTHHAWHLDRDAVWGDRPVVWITGSSITREAFDADLLRRDLAARGLDWGVEKVAFDRGAPLFSWAMLDGMDIRPGDRVLTSVHYDNFRADWLDYIGGFHVYLNHILRPRHLFQVQSLPWADRLEYSLASAPPATFHRAREPFPDGLEGWLQYTLGRTPRRDGPPTIEPPKPFTMREQVENFRELDRTSKLPLGPEELALRDGQVNHDALHAFMDEVRALGAEPWVLFLPPSPEYYERFERGLFSTDFHRYMRAEFHPYVRMSPQPQRNYTDYKHVNLHGRPILTRQLVQLLATTPLGESPVPPPKGD